MLSSDLCSNMFDSDRITRLGTGAGFTAVIFARKVVESDVILAATPSYVKRQGLPKVPGDLAQHDCLRLKRPDEPLRGWRMWREPSPHQVTEVSADPVLIANHTDTLLRAALDGAGIRSEEHTSELQSLMRTSYAVFGLQNKNISTYYINTINK